jgi:hypothetical protein
MDNHAFHIFGHFSLSLAVVSIDGHSSHESIDLIRKLLSENFQFFIMMTNESMLARNEEEERCLEAFGVRRGEPGCAINTERRDDFGVTRYDGSAVARGLF